MIYIINYLLDMMSLIEVLCKNDLYVCNIFHILYLTLTRFEASSGSAEEDWSLTIPSSDSWFDNCSNASASVKCTLEDVNKLEAGEAEAEDWPLEFEDVLM